MKNGGFSDVNPDNYVIVKIIMSFYNDFMDQLTDKEKAIIKNIKFGKN